jgi:hypothetical protein
MSYDGGYSPLSASAKPQQATWCVTSEHKAARRRRKRYAIKAQEHASKAIVEQKAEAYYATKLATPTLAPRVKFTGKGRYPACLHGCHMCHRPYRTLMSMFVNLCKGDRRTASHIVSFVLPRDVTDIPVNAVLLHSVVKRQPKTTTHHMCTDCSNIKLRNKNYIYCVYCCKYYDFRLSVNPFQEFVIEW